MRVHLLRCTVTHYSVIDNELRSNAREETTGYHVRGGMLFLHNSSSSARLGDLLKRAREGAAWSAQAGAPPVYADGEGWGGRNYPAIYVSPDALLELEAAMKCDSCDELPPDLLFPSCKCFS